jgi:hypothetical protein
MKKLGGWVEPFNFNDDQKRDLLLALSPKAKSIKDIDREFVTSCESKIAEWRRIFPGDIRRISDQHNRMQKISKQADNLLKEINYLDQDQRKFLEVVATSILHFTTGKNQLSKINRAYLGESLIESVELLSKSAIKIALESVDQGGSYSPDIEFLISNLAEAYARTYKKKPGYTADSKFGKFVTKLGSIYSFTASRKLLKPIIKNLPPPP